MPSTAVGLDIPAQTCCSGTKHGLMAFSLAFLLTSGGNNCRGLYRVTEGISPVVSNMQPINSILVGTKGKAGMCQPCMPASLELQ